MTQGGDSDRESWPSTFFAEGFLAIDLLEVGPPRLYANRLAVPYRTHRGGRTDAIELLFSYEEPVFDPSDVSCQNLAAMIAVQPALNYGLFCRTIRFHGLFDRADRRFIYQMMENTSREIWVNKLLRPNPFLVLPSDTLPPEKPRRFTQAGIEFSMPWREGVRSGRAWKTDPTRHAVLSSGGKDSLLTYGLLAETGLEVHPVFVNESGRHWFTALNAYRHFRREIPNTARVWTNADRVFNWFLRHFPFVRQDFASVRLDQYPIRLWTVAVFLFPALPLLKKRGIGRLLIGDEHDTTVRGRFRNISHYCGLYDQSRYFDAAMSRYFSAKGWAVVQFSILRPLSELLIEKILVERYPELQALQVSCHAAHLDGNRVKPCGRCEKCRRIVGMLVALGADPAHCGYSPAQVEQCLLDLERKPVHQERAAAQEMLFLLQSRGAIHSMAAAPRLEPAPEVLKLRFHPERSPMRCIPEELRPQVFRKMLQHARGAVRWRQGRWEEFDPMREPDFASAEDRPGRVPSQG
jgi:7-cyano-7-deazaguanine synthase in queuosine biosynthesis